MDKERVKGTVDDAVGRAKRQAGEWTGNTNQQIEGAGQQIKGKAEKAWGNTKDAVRNAATNVRQDQEDARRTGSGADRSHPNQPSHKSH